MSDVFKLANEIEYEKAQAELDIREAHRFRKRNRMLTAKAVGEETLEKGPLKTQALKVYYNGIYGYIPIDLMDDYEFKSLLSFVGKEFTFFVDAIIEGDAEQEMTFIANRKDCLAYQAEQFFKRAKEGDVYPAFVSGVDSYNVWLIVEGVRVRLKREEYSYKYIKDMHLEVFIGDVIDVKITQIDTEARKIQVSRRALEADPKSFLKDYKVGSTYAAKVENIDLDYGIFLSLEPKGVTAVAGFPPGTSLRLLREGEQVNYKITWIDEERGYIGGIIIIPKVGQMRRAVRGGVNGN